LGVSTTISFIDPAATVNAGVAAVKNYRELNPIMKRISRRKMLGSAALMGTVLAGNSLSSAEIQPAKGTSTSSTSKLKIVVTGGHPGDPEYGCGGAIARYTGQGHEVLLLYLNAGEPEGTPESKRGVRTAEAKKACEILGGRPEFAGQIDGAAVLDRAHYEQFRMLLQAQKPNVVFTHWPIDNHADHRAISMLVYDAWLHMRKSFALYYYEVSNGEDTLQFAPTSYVDISSTAEIKHRACLAHASQAPEKFYPLQQRVTQFRGIESGFKEAEAFIRHIQSPDIPLPSA